MRLTKNQTQKIDEALSVLKGALKEELQAMPEQLKKKATFDDAFLTKVADSYLSSAGVLCLLVDIAKDSGGCGGPCYVTCVSPAKTACWQAGTIL